MFSKPRPRYSGYYAKCRFTIHARDGDVHALANHGQGGERKGSPQVKMSRKRRTIFEGTPADFID